MIAMTSNRRLIERLLTVAARNEMNQKKIADAVGRTQSWASLLMQGRISRLQFITRSRIEKFLEGHEGA